MGIETEVVKCNSRGSYDGKGKFWRITFDIKESPEIAKQVSEQILSDGKNAWQRLLRQKGNPQNVSFTFFGDGEVFINSETYWGVGYWAGSEFYKKPTIKSIIKKVDSICNTNAHSQMTPNWQNTDN